MLFSCGDVDDCIHHASCSQDDFASMIRTHAHTLLLESDATRVIDSKQGVRKSVDATITAMVTANIITSEQRDDAQWAKRLANNNEIAIKFRSESVFESVKQRCEEMSRQGTMRIAWSSSSSSPSSPSSLPSSSSLSSSSSSFETVAVSDDASCDDSNVAASSSSHDRLDVTSRSSSSPLSTPSSAVSQSPSPLLAVKRRRLSAHLLPSSSVPSSSVSSSYQSSSSSSSSASISAPANTFNCNIESLYDATFDSQLERDVRTMTELSLSISFRLIDFESRSNAAFRRFHSYADMCASRAELISITMIEDSLKRSTRQMLDTIRTVASAPLVLDAMHKTIDAGELQREMELLAMKNQFGIGFARSDAELADETRTDKEEGVAAAREYVAQTKRDAEEEINPDIEGYDAFLDRLIDGPAEATFTSTSTTAMQIDPEPSSSALRHRVHVPRPADPCNVSTAEAIAMCAAFQQGFIRSGTNHLPLMAKREFDDSFICSNTVSAMSSMAIVEGPHGFVYASSFSVSRIEWFDQHRDAARGVVDMATCAPCRPSLRHSSTSDSVDECKCGPSDSHEAAATPAHRVVCMVMGEYVHYRTSKRVYLLHLGSLNKEPLMEMTEAEATQQGYTNLSTALLQYRSIPEAKRRQRLIAAEKYFGWQRHYQGIHAL